MGGFSGRRILTPVRTPITFCIVLKSKYGPVMKLFDENIYVEKRTISGHFSALDSRVFCRWT